MIRLLVFLLLPIVIPTYLHSTTAPDLRSRITVDGITTDFESNEWVLDTMTSFVETSNDSRWGRDNDISSIAVTWDNYNLYIAVSAVTVSTTLMLYLDTTCGGVDDLTQEAHFLRNIEFGPIIPNFLLEVNGTSSAPISGYIDCTRPINLIDNKYYQSLYLQDGTEEGALEVAIPWDMLGDYQRGADGVRLPSPGMVLGVLAAVTGGQGTGAGDAAPDPSVVLENDSTRVAILDNQIGIPLDSDDDGFLDMGVSPRDVATYTLSPATQESTVRQVLPLRIPLDEKLFSEKDTGNARFPVVMDLTDYYSPVFVTAQVFAADGRIVRSLFEDRPIHLSTEPVWIEWDFKDDRGEVVPGGVYVFAVSGGAGRGTSKNTAKTAFAVAW